MLPWLDLDNSNYSDYQKVNDLAGSITGAYAEATVDGDALTWPVRLGPYGSSWGLFLIGHRGTDFGKVDYQFANADENEYGDGRFTLDVDASFVTLQTRDFYNVAPLKNQDFTESVFRIKGADNATLTSIAGSDPDLPAEKIFDGGAGFYLFRLHTNGQNGSSTGYRVNVVSLTLRRLPG